MALRLLFERFVDFKVQTYFDNRLLKACPSFGIAGQIKMAFNKVKPSCSILKFPFVILFIGLPIDFATVRQTTD